MQLSKDFFNSANNPLKKGGGGTESNSLVKSWPRVHLGLARACFHKTEGSRATQGPWVCKCFYFYLGHYTIEVKGGWCYTFDEIYSRDVHNIMIPEFLSAVYSWISGLPLLLILHLYQEKEEVVGKKKSFRKKMWREKASF